MARTFTPTAARTAASMPRWTYTKWLGFARVEALRLYNKRCNPTQLAALRHLYDDGYSVRSAVDAVFGPTA